MSTNTYQLYISPRVRFLNIFRKLFILTHLDNILAYFTRRIKRDSIIHKLIPPNYLYSPQTFRSCSVDGIHYWVDLSDRNGHFNYFGMKEDERNELFSIILKGMIVYDIGANIGTFTLNFAKRVTPSGSVISFEPSRNTYQLASRNISLNPFKNITLLNIGLGEQQTNAILYNVNPNNRGMGRLLPENNNTNSKPEEVIIDTLDNRLTNAGLPKPDLIKIDVEGYELKVLKGAVNTLRDFKPVLFIELDDKNLREQDNSARELIIFLKNLGYEIIHSVSKASIDENFDFENQHFDILCTISQNN